MKRASTVSGAAIFVILLLSISTTMNGAANSSAPGVSYMNLRFASFKAPPGPLSTVNAVDGTPDPGPYTAAPILRSDGINGIRFDGMSWSQYDILGVSGWQNAINYEATAFDQQGISIVWGLPILDDIRAVPCDLLFYAESSNPGTSQIPNFCGFGGSGSNPTIQSQAVALFESDATYWGRTTNTQYTAANGTVVPAGFYHWSYASQYSGLPVWQAYAMMLSNTVPTLMQHPSTYALKLWNEPYTGYSWTSAELSSYDSYVGQQLRGDGWAGYIAYSSLYVAPSTSDIESFAPKSSGGSYLFPLMFEFHYPTTTDLANVRSAVSAMGGAPNMEGWDGEDWVSYLNGQNGGQPSAQQQASYGVTANAFSFDYTTPPTAATQQLITAFDAAYGQPFFYSATSSTSSSASTSTPTSTTASSSSSATSRSSSSTTSSTGLSSCSPSGACLSWGYGPTTVNPGVETQWQALVTVPSGTSPVGIPIVWYLDGSAAYSTTTGTGGNNQQGTSYFNSQLAQGAHTLYFAISGAQSPVLTITAGTVATTTTTTTTTTTSSTSSSSSSTTAFLSSSSSSVSSSSSSSTTSAPTSTTTQLSTTSLATTTVTSDTVASTTLAAASSQTSSQGSSTTSAATTSSSTTATTGASDTVASTTTTVGGTVTSTTAITTATGGHPSAATGPTTASSTARKTSTTNPRRTNGTPTSSASVSSANGSQSPATSALLYPQTSTLAAFVGTIALVSLGLVFVARPQHYGRSQTRQAAHG